MANLPEIVVRRDPKHLLKTMLPEIEWRLRVTGNAAQVPVFQAEVQRINRPENKIRCAYKWLRKTDDLMDETGFTNLAE